MAIRLGSAVPTLKRKRTERLFFPCNNVIVLAMFVIASFAFGTRTACDQVRNVGASILNLPTWQPHPEETQEMYIKFNNLFIKACEGGNL